jgi:hypothetical protein
MPILAHKSEKNCRLLLAACAASFAALMLFLCGCSTAPKAPPAGQVLTPPAPYVRIHRADSNVVELQIAARKFLPAGRKGPAVWMSGVAHIGDSNYFSRLQQHLDAQTLVLFEGIGGEPNEGHPVSTTSTNADLANNKVKLSSFQMSLAESLGLVFQLDAIDYDRAHFRSSDLTVEELRSLMTDVGADRSFEGLMQTMEGSSWLDGILQITLRFLGTNPRLQGLAKLMLIEVLGQVKGDPSELSGLPPNLKQLLEVLIAQRNQKVLADLTAQLRRSRRSDSISIFYGTGHMPDLETRFRQQLDYRPVEELWFTAFSVDLARAGISESERKFIDDFIRRQLDQLK